MKSCTHCKLIKPLDDFHKSTKAKDQRASWCKSCSNNIHRVYRKRNYTPENKRKWQLQTRYGMTVEQVNELFELQNKSCAICQKQIEKFHIDHDHNNGLVRGILCHKCNIRLGGWDDLEWRQSAMNYLGIKK